MRELRENKQGVGRKKIGGHRADGAGTFERRGLAGLSIHERISFEIYKSSNNDSESY